MFLIICRQSLGASTQEYGIHKMHTAMRMVVHNTIL